MTAPITGAKYTAPATVSLAATATDPDGSVARVDFFSGTTLIGSSTTPPYAAIWNNVVAGTYILKATAIDNAGKAGSSSTVTITVAAVTTVITTPAANAVVPATFAAASNEYLVPVTGTFTGPADTTIIVTAGGGHSKLATLTGNSFTASVVVTPGLNTLDVAVARRDGTTDLATRAFTAVLPPLVVLTSPSQCAQLAVPANITFAADALSRGGTITKVEFSEQGVLVGTATVPPYTFAHTLTQVGSRSLAAVATDNTGQTANSAVTVSCTSPPPTVALTSPAPGSVIRAGAPIAFTASATTSAAGGSIASVEFLINGSVVATDTTAPYSASVNASGSGTQSLTARAIDNLGVSTTSAPVPISVTANASPTVTLEQPTAGQSVAAGGMVNLAATASDADGSIAKVEFFANGSLITNATRITPPYTATWTASGTGSVTLTARATDNDGAATTTPGTAIMVTAVVVPPVAITAPANNAVITSTPLTVSIHAVAASGATLTKIELFDGMTLLTSVNTPAVNTIDFNYVWSNPATGMHTLTAKSTDSNGLVSTSAIVSITVPIPPTIVLSTLSNYFIAPAGIDLIAETSAAAGATIAKVEFFSGAALVGTVMTAPYTYRMANSDSGGYSFTAKVTDSQGVVVTSNAASAIVSAGVTLTFAAGLNNITVSDDNISVTGVVDAPPNSGILINGQLALIGANGTFSANAIPLLAASNTITATVTAQDGETATQTITVNRASLPLTGELVAPMFRVSLDQDEGIIIPGGTFAVEVNKENLAGLPVNSVMISCAAPTVPAGATSFGKSTCTYNQPGTYKVEVVVKDTMEVVIYSKAKVVKISRPNENYNLSMALYRDVIERLASGNINRAVNLFTNTIRESNRTAFIDAGANLATMVAALGTVKGVQTHDHFAELYVVRPSAQGDLLFSILMMRDGDGIWRIDAF